MRARPSGIDELVAEAEAVAGHPVGEIAADVEVGDRCSVLVEASRTALESVDQMDQLGRKSASTGELRVASVEVCVGGAETEVEVGAVLTHGEVAVVWIGGEGDDTGRAGEGEAAGLDPGLDSDSVVGNRGRRDLGCVPGRGGDGCGVEFQSAGRQPGDRAGVGDGEIERCVPMPETSWTVEPLPSSKV